ncbi:MAG: bifunctional anthranilate synthase component I family protein/class IV aminotransferase [Alcaligenaceae bacterium]|nr:bifunctional anthranilate synthase component I family protein/class IV aminotransferase [Alcaligenaceae bacterium]
MTTQSLNHFVLLDDVSSDRATLLSDFHSHLCFDVAQLSQLDSAVSGAWEQGLSTFFYIPYEFGVELVNEQLSPEVHDHLNRHIHVFCFRKKQSLNSDEIRQYLDSHPDEAAGIAEAKLSIGPDDFYQKIEAVRAAISRGDLYQINFTTTLDFKSYGHPLALYRRLRKQQQVPYGALAHLPIENQPWLLCFSPELFLEILPDAMIRAKPMKGTAPILDDGQDEQRALDLKRDLKNRAENLMIVDLLRNDLGRIANIGQVKVPALFEVNRFGAVWQMTSTIEAQMPSNLKLSELIQATFPCGSITGAPKKMSMQLINQLEQRQRGIYTGSIGLIEANSDAEPLNSLSFFGQLNVMIRSFHLQEVDGHYQASVGVGSGVVIDSQPELEYEECLWKVRFLLGLVPEFGIFETMRWENGACVLLERHKARLLSSAEALRYPLTAEALAQAWCYFLQELPKQGVYRLKLSLQPNQHVTQSHKNSWRFEFNTDFSLVATLYELEELAPNQSLLVNKNSVFQLDYLSRHKTDQRSVYDLVLNQATTDGAFDQLLFDHELTLLEGARSNVFLKIDGQWYTPCHELPLLNGVMRQEVMANPWHYLGAQEVIEAHLHYDDVIKAEEIALSNALRGLIRVKRLLV